MIKEKLKKFIDKNPETGVRPMTIWLSKPWAIILLTVIVLGFVLLLSVNQIMNALLHSRPEVVIPNIEGKSLIDSLKIVSDLDLTLKQDATEFDESLPAGTIIRQAPPPDMKVRTGRAVRVVVSKGGEAVFVPLVLGKGLAEAQSALAVDGLQLGSVKEVFSTDVSAGEIVSQSVSSGTVVTRGALVDIQISKGPPLDGAPIVPDFVGQRIGNARDWADGVGVQIQLKEDPKAAGVAGSVVKQIPSSGQTIQPGGVLKITVVPLIASDQGFRLSYNIPKEEEFANIRIMARDNRGESEIYRGEHNGGDTIEIPMDVNSTTRVYIYVNEVLKDERVVEP